MENQIVIQNADEYEARGNKAMIAVREVEVTDEATNAKMGEILSKIKLGKRTIEAKINEPIEQANKLHKWLTSIRNKILSPWNAAEEEAKKRMGNYNYKLMVEKREAQRKADEERRKLEEKQAQKAAEALAKNKPEKAEAILSKPVQPKTVVPEIPKTENQVAVFEYTWELEDAALVPDEYWDLATSKITAKVKKEKLECKIPGIKVIESAGIRSR